MYNIKNIAIIAHVDHGKTTLVDKIIYFSNIFRENEKKESLIMDNNDIEKERGITIFSKNISVFYKDCKINIIDTPGHADFGGEVERVLKMAEGVILLVDAFEGPMPQTRFVLSKALHLKLKPIIIINKVDKENCRPDIVYDNILDLFFDLDADEEQLSFPVIYGSSKEGWFNYSNTKINNIIPLMDTILNYIPSPIIKEGPFQMQITSLDYSKFLGRIAIGKINRGYVNEGDIVCVCNHNYISKSIKIKELYVFDGLYKKKVNKVICGDICGIVGLDFFKVGDTICDVERVEPLNTLEIDEPTINITIGINNSPFYGRDGKYVTSKHLWDRLMNELESNLALKVNKTDDSNIFLVSGRGVMHISVLIETMRREGYEMTVGQPQVIYKYKDGIKYEPNEKLVIDVPEKYSSKIIDLVTRRKGDLMVMNNKNGIIHLEFEIPSRGIIGLRSIILACTGGELTMSHNLKDYQIYKGDIDSRGCGVLISKNQGISTAYSISKLQDRGKFFISPGEEVYEGMIVGENSRNNDLIVNVTEGKKLTNIRAAGKDESSYVQSKIIMTLEELIEYIQFDEVIEVTPNNLRLRKIILNESIRKRQSKK